jgi:hypothetical protein
MENLPSLSKNSILILAREGLNSFFPELKKEQARAQRKQPVHLSGATIKLFFVTIFDPSG